MEMMDMDTANVGYSYQLRAGASWTHRVRHSLARCSDVFSEFNKYIAPAYHHDRCERSAPMRIYTMHKGELVMVLVSFAACVALGVFIGLAGPAPFVSTSVSGDRSALSAVAATGRAQFTVRTAPLEPRARQLWLHAEVRTGDTDEEIFDKSFQISISIAGVGSSSRLVPLSPSPVANRTARLQCGVGARGAEGVCAPLLVAALGTLPYARYVLTVSMYGLRHFHDRYHIREVIFYMKTYNPSFTQLETWFRFIFLCTTFIVTVWFLHSLRQFPARDWAIEQRWLTVLLPLLLLYNDPLFPCRMVWASCLPALVSSVAADSFLAAALLAWLALYHGLRQTSRDWLVFYLPKLCVVCGLWAPTCGLAVWTDHCACHDPVFEYVGTTSYMVCVVVFFVCLSLYLSYLATLAGRAYSDLGSMPYFDMRLRCLTCVAGMTLVIGGLSLYYVSGPLVPHIARRASSSSYNDSPPHPASAAPFMCLLTLLNAKLYVMAYLYSPGQGGAPSAATHETSITKDNPAFSMINDSDEDVLYGSDEDSRRPLTARRAHGHQQI